MKQIDAKSNLVRILICIWKRPLMMSNFWGDGGSEMTPKKSDIRWYKSVVGGDGESKIIENHRHPFWMIPIMFENIPILESAKDIVG